MAEFRPDHLIVRDYVTAYDHLQYTQLPDGVVAILLTHSNLPAKHLDIRLDLHTKIEDVKEKFRTHIGTPAQHQRLILRRDGVQIKELSDNSKMLGFYSVVSGMEIHVIDTDPFSMSRGGGLTDTSLIQKYTMAEDVYDKRKGTIREFIREKRKNDPSYKMKPKSQPGQPATFGASGGDGSTEQREPPPGVESIEGVVVGARCEVQPGARRGLVQFVGEIKEIKAGGYWVGVKFDEPLGHNDGTVKGTRIFECEDGYGAFVRGNKVATGDFPERDLFADDDDEEEEEGERGGDKEEEEDDEDEI